MKTFYIATSLKNAMQAEMLSDKLEASGKLKNLFPWFKTPDDNNMPREKLSIIANEEIKAAFDCDLFIKLFAKSRGAHVELGAAIASTLVNEKKQIFMHSDKEADYLQDPSAFYFHKSIKLLSGDINKIADDLIVAVAELT